jgi:hypothetical protein
MLGVLKGRKPLFVAFWGYFFFGSMIFSFAFRQLLKFFGHGDDIGLLACANYAYAIASSIGVWRCALNADSLFWGYFARIIIILFFGILILSLFIAFATYLPKTFIALIEELGL